MSRFEISTAEQRSEAWFAARCGKATGSCAADILAKLKGAGEAAARRDYRVKLAIERITGKPQEDVYINAAMQRGIDLEPAGLSAYEAHSGNIVRQTGFLSMLECQAGCSLDGDIDDFTGIFELKCPKSATHIGYLRDRVLPREYIPQVTHNMFVSGAKWLDFASFDDRMPEGLQFFCVRVTRESLDLAGYETELRRFLAEVSVEVQSLLELRVAA